MSPRVNLPELELRFALGHRYVVLVAHRKKPPRGERVRIMPGVLGRYIGPAGTRPHAYLVDVPLVDLIREMKRTDR